MTFLWNISLKIRVLEWLLDACGVATFDSKTNSKLQWLHKNAVADNIKAGKEVLMLGDFNKCLCQVTELELHDLMLEVTNNIEFPTHARGHKRIDFALGTSKFKEFCVPQNQNHNLKTLPDTDENWAEIAETANVSNALVTQNEKHFG